MKTIRQLYSALTTFGSNLQSPFLLAVRLYWGWQFMQTGVGHLTHLDKVTDYFGQLGIPAPSLMAPLISALELGGGFLLAIGLASRLIAFLLTCNMMVAFVTGDREALFSIFTDPDKFYAAAPYTFLMASLLVLIFGPGRYCLDALLEKRLFSKERGGDSREWPNAMPAATLSHSLDKRSANL
jgi:putative oxidoreductase